MQVTALTEIKSKMPKRTPNKIVSQVTTTRQFEMMEDIGKDPESYPYINGYHLGTLYALERRGYVMIFNDNTCCITTKGVAHLQALKTEVIAIW